VEYIRFLDIACGSVAELETQLLLSSVFAYIDEPSSTELLQKLADVERMLSALMRSLRQRLSSNTTSPATRGA
jgi:four helix bundle protein